MGRKSIAGSIAIALLTVLAVTLGPASSARAATLTVNSTTDAVDTNPGDGQCITASGQCTLRAAVQEANALPDPDLIILPAGVYTITLAGPDDIAAKGDLDITGDTTIEGAGRTATIVDGGAINRVFETWNNSTQVTISHLTMRHGQTQNSQSGGGILNRAQTTLDDVVISDNTAVSGGGIGSIDGSLILTDVTVSHNLATNGNGGGINAVGTITLISSTVSSNNASAGTGGIAASGTLTLINSTISGNIGDSGGGISTSGPVTLKNSTIANNNSGATNGGGVSTTSTVAMWNTILAGNTGGIAPDCVGTFTSQGYNLLGNNTGCMFGAGTGDQVGTAGNPIDPKLGPLQNNGGATFTHAPLPGSPAIDGGNPSTPGNGGNTCESTDQIGTNRPQGHACDIGAVEVFPTPAITSLSPSAAMAGDAAFTLTINGVNFGASTQAQWNGANRPTTFVSSTQLQIQISAADIAVSGAVVVTVSNPSPSGGSSNQAVFAINSTTGNPTPTIDNLAPNLATVGAGGFTLTINGTNFVNGSIVRWNGADRPTTFIDSAHLTASISAADVAAVSAASVAVVNPMPGGGISNTQSFNIVRRSVFLALTERAPGVPAPRCNDVEPDNDIPRDAPLLAYIGQACIGTFDQAPHGYDDLYKIVVDTRKTIVVDLTNIPTGLDPTLALYDKGLGTNANTKALCVSRNVGSASEHIVRPNAAPGVYYIGIFWRQQSSVLPNTYLLKVASENKPAACSP